MRLRLRKRKRRKKVSLITLKPFEYLFIEAPQQPSKDWIPPYQVRGRLGQARNDAKED
jgi:hypothetical protein